MPFFLRERIELLRVQMKRVNFDKSMMRLRVLVSDGKIVKEVIGVLALHTIYSLYKKDICLC